MVDWFSVYDKASEKKGVTISLVNDTEVLACWLFDIPTKQQEASKKVIELTSAINKVKDEISVLEARVSLVISEEVDDKGKPRFANQSIRDAESLIRLNKLPSFLNKKKELVSLFEELGKCKAEVDYWGIMFSAVKNEIYHRRRIEELDKVELINKDKVKSFLDE